MLLLNINYHLILLLNINYQLMPTTKDYKFSIYIVTKCNLSITVIIKYYKLSMNS